MTLRSESGVICTTLYSHHRAACRRRKIRQIHNLDIKAGHGDSPSRSPTPSEPWCCSHQRPINSGVFLVFLAYQAGGNCPLNCTDSPRNPWSGPLNSLAFGEDARRVDQHHALSSAKLPWIGLRLLTSTVHRRRVVTSIFDANSWCIIRMMRLSSCSAQMAVNTFSGMLRRECQQLSSGS